MKRGTIIGGVFLVLISTAFLLNSNRENAPVGSGPTLDIVAEEDLSEMRPLPPLVLEDYDGNPVHLADFIGRPLVINSWAVWCPFCKQELPEFVELQRELGERIVVIAVDRAEPGDVARDYTDELGISDDLVFLLDPDDLLYDAIHGIGMPETIFVDEDGIIRDHKRGPMKLDEMRERVEAILQ